MAKCKSCGADIIWIKTATSSMPCDPQPCFYRLDKKGDASIVTQNGEVVKATLVDPPKAFGIGYISHFATCPSVAQHRKRPETAGEQQRMVI